MYQRPMQNALVRFGDLDMCGSRNEAPRVFAQGRVLSKAVTFLGLHAAKIAHARVTPLRKRSWGFSFVRVLCGARPSVVPVALASGSTPHVQWACKQVRLLRAPHKALAGSVRSRTDIRVTPMNRGTGSQTGRPSPGCAPSGLSARDRRCQPASGETNGCADGIAASWVLWAERRKNQPGEGRKPALSPLGNLFQSRT